MTSRPRFGLRVYEEIHIAFFGRVAGDVVGDAELWVFGSQSILGQHSDVPDSLRMSIEVDMDPKNRPESYLD